MNNKEFHKRLGNPPSFQNAKKSFERDLLETALKKANNYPSRAAKLVGLKHQTFIRRMAKHPGLTRTPVKKRRRTLATEDHYIVITKVGPNPLNVAKLLSQQIPNQTNQEQLFKKLTSSESEIVFKTPTKGRAQHLCKLLKKHKAAAHPESVPLKAKTPIPARH